MRTIADLMQGQMNHHRLKLSLGAALIVILGVTLAIWYLRIFSGVTTVDPAHPPQPILDAADLEKLSALQNTLEVFALSEVSPDDSTMIVAVSSGEDAASGQASWLNIQTGELEPLPADFLTLFPQTPAVWQDNQTAIYLSNDEIGDPILVKLDRSTGEVKPEALPVNGRPLGLAPNGLRALVEIGSDVGIDLLLLDLVTGGHSKLLSYLPGGGPQSIAWTTDGSQLAFTRYEVSPDLASDQAKINEIVMQDALGNLPLSENPIFTGNVVEVYELGASSQQRGVLHTDDGDGYLFHKVMWSPDGQQLLTKMVRPTQPSGRAHPVVVVGAFPDRAYYRIYDVNLNLKTKLDRPEIEAPLASHALFVSENEVVVVAAHGLSFHLYHFDLLSGEFHALPTGEGTFGESPLGYQVSVTHNTRQLIYNQSSFYRPAEIYRLALDGGEPDALTQFNAQAEAANQIRVDEIHIKMDDGTARIGYLLQAADASFPPNNVPLVLYQQGGPGGAMTNRWGATAEEPFNLLPNFGFALLFVPFSGREGFGPTFFSRLADDDHFGQLDIDEGAQTVHYLFEQHYTQPGQVGITGCSYGGYYASQSIVQYPDLYAAANVQCAVLDLAKWWEENPFLVTFMQGALPTEQPEEYRRDSPAFHAAAVKTPLLLFHGQDDVLPVQIVRNFRNGIDEDQTPVEMFIFKNEGHGLALSTSRLVAAQQQIAWFRKYLLP